MFAKRKMQNIKTVQTTVALLLVFLAWTNSYPYDDHAAIHTFQEDDRPWTELDVNDSTIVNLVNFYKDTLLGKSYSRYSTNISSILSARQKDNRYEAALEVNHWDCRDSACRLIKFQKCVYTMLPLSVVHRPAALPHECYEPKFTSLPVDEVPGGTFKVDVNDTKLLEAVESALEYLRNHDTGPESARLLEVVEATSQTTTSTTYRILANLELSFYMTPLYDKQCYLEVSYDESSNQYKTVHHDCNCSQNGI